MFINTQRLNSTQEKETGGFRSEHRNVKSEEISGWRISKGDIKGGRILAEGKQGISKWKRPLIRIQRHYGRSFSKLVRGL